MSVTQFTIGTAVAAEKNIYLGVMCIRLLNKTIFTIYRFMKKQAWCSYVHHFLKDLADCS